MSDLQALGWFLAAVVMNVAIYNKGRRCRALELEVEDLKDRLRLLEGDLT